MKWIKFFTVLILTLSVLSILIIIPSGSHYCHEAQCGIYFWGAHEHDSIWHLAVANNLFQHWPFQMPNMSGVAMAGYNYLLDIVVASLALITRISVSVWYFKILPIAWLISTIYLSYRFAKSYRKSNTYPLFVWFFVFFGSSFSYLLSIKNTGVIWGSSGILSMQSLQNMLNPQLAWSFLCVLAVLIGINQGKNSFRDYLKYGLLTMIAFGLKFYTGAVLLMILGFDLLLTLRPNLKQIMANTYKGITALGMSLLSILIFYNPQSGGESPLTWKPWATINPIVEDQSLLYIKSWAQRIYDYHDLKLILLEIAILIIFILLNYGSRILAIFGQVTNDNLSNNHTKRLIILSAIFSMLLSILFVQRGVWWNTVQFLYVSLFLTGLLAAEGLDKLVKTKKFVGYLLTALIILLTIPTNIDVLRTFIRFPGTSYISDMEMEGLEYLRTQPDGVVLTPLFSRSAQQGKVTNLSGAYDTAFVTAYSGKQTYLSDVIQLELTNIDYKNRESMYVNFECQMLTDVKYIYEYQDSQYVNKFSGCDKAIDRLFNNDLVAIYKIK